ncbi:hypothetical protein [Rathayibacter toxicus]|uniref:Sporulation protein n=1 Tax=Rathayibacter toxicus TaxID=145458 RepID=A0A0C5BEA5_9MICO|nr:hypothetical protein [Rathayibacter toxicus]AJM77586.1 hypothetical protein TI83_05810 [Rathayibacter toxicus]ALS56486.1 hypothetical protein APU90_00660 [Rathayibacter toxicus]KKM44590.1 hypothetical protein VT73_08630 [Rathayibacter toxicus]PPG21694.1 hypothetical protein C5D15_05610 [Rathayibacter toxicus]PPG46656.1 hypothetical protein C5D16_05585 [Rathayibacter toxicus]
MPNIAVSLADTVTTAGTSTIYGDPVTVDGVSLVPVALRWFGFGGGGGSQDGQEGGGGGGATVIPIGAYIKDDLGLRFQPNIVSVLAVGIPLVCVTGKALARVIRALKK